MQGFWAEVNDGSGRDRPWFVAREGSSTDALHPDYGHEREFHRSYDGCIVKFASGDSARRRAQRLNGDVTA